MSQPAGPPPGLGQPRGPQSSGAGRARDRGAPERTRVWLQAWAGPPCHPACPRGRRLASVPGSSSKGPRTMNSSSCPDAWLPPAEYVQYAYLVLLLVLGLLLNALALWVLCCRLRRWTETRVYMVNLASADLCLLCTLPFMVYSLTDRSSTGDTVLCQVSQSVYLVNRYMSISLITAIAVDRYVAVRHPLYARRLRSPRQAGAVCAALWALVAGSLGLRWALKDREGGFCFGNPARQHPKTVVFSLLGFYLPLAVLLPCSLQVVAALGRRPASGAGQAEASRRAARMVWANLAVFVVCFLPLHVVLTWRLATGLSTCAIDSALLVTSKVSDANCCLDAVCYYYMAKEFQEASALAGGPGVKAQRSQGSLCVTVA
ncbi:G-protein coupled receptor 35-like isoform X2 [Phyllostomus hastatus]|uniref:G-protein coupled receptor 35-like isoform X2 n=1 Tax=Phyllostomus hastatus TaxID=9423 RepID=UPI001E683604|nr:G-protein coupled receptor 35-like isoform X2 [Phyllostomus hastatus]